ncbi:ImmA/IrrE family metallo-endopeptidase [Paenibacillus sp. LHD-117]|uniref:ImmA/IrrE family metallo-endopeptidase n=1 Tax=Paenibacillus sp. LHD-117 TaxID=3071412 RepID=UPI0027E10609|nr:ImmA/IrrE family metallo-endopeptidase [Paenibacillus sp. LHD-117]MDQ6420204.1 ImmA/IrrE family metallo-endopeptidase [Paenibacillus sp. LHD-117]
MQEMSFDDYRPADMELWIASTYERNGIHYPGDLDDWDRIASLFGAHIAYTEGETKVIYDEDGDCLIFLNLHLEPAEQRLAFFHELSHPALHAGDQRRLPPAFVELQESQAALFQLYSAIPYNMLKELAHLRSQPHYHRLIAGAFGVPLSFARKRLERIERRLQQEQSDRNLRAKLAALSAKVCGYEYPDAAQRLLVQLSRQTARKKRPKPKERSL